MHEQSIIDDLLARLDCTAKKLHTIKIDTEDKTIEMIAKEIENGVSHC